MKTPKTDAAVIDPRPVVVTGNIAWHPELVYAQFARQLETQVQELREALALLIVASDHKCGVAEQANHARAVLERTK